MLIISGVPCAEKTTRPFLRGREFLWQEDIPRYGRGGKKEETLRMLEIYADVAGTAWPCPSYADERLMKSSQEPARRRVWMHDGKALQEVRPTVSATIQRHSIYALPIRQ